MTIYDPMFEVGAGIKEATRQGWQATWIWYPGQLAAHLHTLVSQKSLRRCTHIGYPGNFQKPECAAVFRFHGQFGVETPVRWAAPLGRTRLRINGREGDITLRQGVLPPGRVEILVTQDMTESLPCILLEGEGVSSGPGWEASLDGETWLPVEFNEKNGAPERLPDREIDSSIELQPRRLVSLTGGRETDGGFILEAGGVVLLDFWHDELGQLVIDAQGQADLTIHVGETEREAQELNGELLEQYPLAPVKVTRRGGTYCLPERLLRFVRIEASAACHIEKVTFQARVYPVEYKGSFECSDSQLTEIWNVAAATLHSNLHDGCILDGLKRDALVWLFDGNIGFDGADCLFFDRNVVHNTLLSLAPPKNFKKTDVGIPDNLMYFVLGFYQDYLASGEESFAHLHRESILSALTMLESLQGKDGFLAASAFSVKNAITEEAGLPGVDYLGEFFPDWAGKSDKGEIRPTDLDTAGTPAYAQMLLLRCFEAGVLFAQQWGEDQMARRYLSNVWRLGRAIRREFWDPKRKAFINGLDRNGNKDPRFSPYAQAWGILTGLVDAKGAPALVKKVMCNAGLRPANASMGVYWDYLAYIQTGRFDLVLAELRRLWGWMLAQGYSRFVEDIRPGDAEPHSLAFYDQPFALSLNHSWAGAAAVSALMRGTLGLRIVDYGYQLVELSPNWTAFEWVKLTLPTPHGSIELDYDQARGALLRLPAGVNVRLVGGRLFSGPGEYKI
jgi:alpha-L-rhamnosidase